MINILFRLLSESRGSLLDNEELVEALNKSKSTSIKVEEDLSTIEKKEAVIDSTRQVCYLLDIYFLFKMLYVIFNSS